MILFLIIAGGTGTAAAFYHQTDDQHYLPSNNNGCSSAGESSLPFSLSDLPEPPIPLSEIGPIPPPPMFSSPSPLPPHRTHLQQQREQMAQQREREQNLAAAIAMVVQSARNVDMYSQSSQGDYLFSISIDCKTYLSFMTSSEILPWFQTHEF
jgi:hypothetical protein